MISAPYISVQETGLIGARAAISKLGDAIADFSVDSPIAEELSLELADIARMQRDAVTQNVPVRSGSLWASVQMKKPVADGTALISGVRAGAKKKGSRENYGWFTELGTDVTANHAVDKIGYQHRQQQSMFRTNTSTNQGIPAQRWFSRGIESVSIEEIRDRIAAAISRGVQRVLSLNQRSSGSLFAGLSPMSADHEAAAEQLFSGQGRLF